MKKLILISLVIFFAICSKSWSNEIDGKGLQCIISELDGKKVDPKYYKQEIWYFSENKVAEVELNEQNLKLQLNKYNFTPRITTSIIEWSKKDKWPDDDYIYFQSVSHRLDRNTLKLKSTSFFNGANALDTIKTGSM